MDRRTINKIVVVGGGSAGWFTALYAKTVMPDKDITVIESDSIGILGAGEGTTPDVVRLLDILDIPVSELIKNTGCTLKNGVKFLNWNGGGVNDYFYHGFYPYGELSPENYEINFMASSAPFIYTSSVAKNEPFSKADFASKISELNKLPFIKNQSTGFPSSDNPIFDYVNVANYSLHVDAAKLAQYLKNTATFKRGIKLIEGVVVDFKQDETGDVKKLILESGQEVSSDFVFDCSGFSRFFGKRFDSTWVSHKERLPSDSALPFFLSLDEEDPIPTSGLAVAMNNGWMWKTPLQHRYGCGYVFDSSKSSFDEAKQEVEEFLGIEIDPIKEIKYSAGYYSNPWRYNVVSIGLSSGFIEPLEASSMWVTNASMARLLSNPEVMFVRDEKAYSDFNKRFSKMNEEVADFIYFHHMTNREDTEFWRCFTLENAPEGVKEILDLFETRLPGRDDFIDRYWQIDSWYKVGLAHRNTTIEKSIKRSISHNSFTRHIFNMYERYKEVIDSAAPLCVDHREFINHMKT